jgi:hypothetical protein
MLSISVFGYYRPLNGLHALIAMAFLPYQNPSSEVRNGTLFDCQVSLFGMSPLSADRL